MVLSRIELVNQKNFQKCDVELSGRTFIVGANASGKSNFLDAFRFLHDLVKTGGGLQTAVSSRGGMKNFLQRLATMNKTTSAAYFRRVNEILKLAVPQLDELKLSNDAMGVPHLEARYEHWRAKGSKQQEEQFSDGTLRLIGFLFALLDSKGVVLETNLHSAIVAQLPEFISKLQRSKKETRQVFITTHSYDMLSNVGISSDEVVLLKPSKEGTEVINAATLDDINAELEAGFTVADAIIPHTKPGRIDSITDIKL